jgi:hypothetical protein
MARPRLDKRMKDRLRLIKVRFEDRHKFGSSWAETADEDIAWLIDAALVGQRLLGSVEHLRAELQRLREALELVAREAEAEAERFDLSFPGGSAHEVKLAVTSALARLAHMSRTAAHEGGRSPQAGARQQQD